MFVRLIVTLAVLAVASASWESSTAIQIFEGVLEGFFHGEIISLENCATNAEDAFYSIQNAANELDVDGSSMSRMGSAIEDIADAIEEIENVAKDCKSAYSQVMQLVSSIENGIADLPGFAFHCGKDLIMNGVHIYDDVKHAESDWKNQNYREFGVNIGKIIDLVAVGSGFKGTMDSDSVGATLQSLPTSSVSDPYSPTIDNSDKCNKCKDQVTKLDIKWGQGNTDDAVADLKAKCKAKEGKHFVKREICDKIVEKFANIPPQIFKGMEGLEWDIPLGTCATLKQCKMECCGSQNPPEQVHLSLAAEDRSLMGVSWVTLNKNETFVQYGQSADKLDMSNEGNTMTYTQAGWIGTIHRAIMTDLKPATKYFYRVGSPTSDSWSEVFSFKTYNPEQKQQVFAVLADMDFDSKGAMDTIAKLTAMVDAGKLDAVVHSGDISYADGYEPHWDIYFNKIQPIAARIPYMVTAGNHEFWYNFAAYKARFFMPSVDKLQGSGSGDSMYYGWKYGPISFAAMNSETAIDTQNFNKKQLKFWEEELPKVDRTATPFLIAHFHRPLYCSNDGTCSRGDGKINKLTKKGEDMMYGNKVDMVISGHVHDYERTYPMYKEKLVSKDFSATTYQAPLYIVQGASGNREGNKGTSSWPSPEPEWSAGHSSDVGYGLMTVENNEGERPTLLWQFMRSSDNVELDTFTLQK